MRALQKHVPDPAITAGNSIQAPLHATDQTELRPRRRSNRDLRTVVAVMVATEYFTAALASYFASLIYGWCFVGNTLPATQYIFSAICIASLLIATGLGFRQFASVQSQPRHSFIIHGLGAIVLAFSLFLSMLFLLKFGEHYSRVTFFLQFFAVCTAVLWSRTAWHRAVCNAVARGTIQAQRVILIGDPAHRSSFGRDLSARGVNVVASLDAPGSAARAAARAEQPVSADIDPGSTDIDKEFQLIKPTCRWLLPDHVILLTTANCLRMTCQLSRCLSDLPVAVLVVLVDAPDVLATSRIVEFGHDLAIEVLKQPLSTFDLFLKRFFDLVAAAAALIVLFPLLLMVALAIKLDSAGPVLFRQTRHGFNKTRIKVFKFRTMTTIENGSQFRQAVRNDPRITRLGRLLRRTNIDELPQLLNVLLGQMSIVGPRPHATAHNKMFENRIGSFARRHNVKPGLTGWAQVNGCRGETDTLDKMERRVELDLQYIDNWSFFFDLRICVLTLFCKKAYANAF
jgi:Undecaprenyl-phosphate glucose phosphotransferase